MQVMTIEQWGKEKSRLTGAVTRAKTKMKQSGSLADKIEAKVAVIRAEESLRKHKLNYHELVSHSH